MHTVQRQILSRVVKIVTCIGRLQGTLISQCQNHGSRRRKGSHGNMSELFKSIPSDKPRLLEALLTSMPRNIVQVQVLGKNPFCLVVNGATVDVAETAKLIGAVPLPCVHASCVKDPDLAVVALPPEHLMEKTNRQRKLLRETHEGESLAEASHCQPRLGRRGPSAVVHQIVQGMRPAVPRELLDGEPLHGLRVLPEAPRRPRVRPAREAVEVGGDELLARLPEDRREAAPQGAVLAV
mmetsp:Transcript_55013/g.170408  ORF Transcript_55013/g.170408 Transcript_55013/m.170408 type:complete len:238 (+) Transcript_55013:19-732(+)